MTEVGGEWLTRATRPNYVQGTPDETRTQAATPEEPMDKMHMNAGIHNPPSRLRIRMSR